MANKITSFSKKYFYRHAYELDVTGTVLEARGILDVIHFQSRISNDKCSAFIKVDFCQKTPSSLPDDIEKRLLNSSEGIIYQEYELHPAFIDHLSEKMNLFAPQDLAFIKTFFLTDQLN